MSFAIDFNQVEDKQDFELLPNGEYVAVVQEAELRDTRAGGEGINVKLEIVEGQYKGRYVFDWINIKNSNPDCVKWGLESLKQLVVAACIDTSRPFTEVSELNGKVVCIRVGVQKGKDGYDDSNKVKSYKSAVKQATQQQGNNLAAGQQPTWG